MNSSSLAAAGMLRLTSSVALFLVVYGWQICVQKSMFFKMVGRFTDTGL
jgi:hypothetical protein